MHLWGSNLIIEYLLKTYPGLRPVLRNRRWRRAMTRPRPPPAMLETITDSIMNLRQMKMSGLEPNQVAYLRRQRERIDV